MISRRDFLVDTAVFLGASTGLHGLADGAEAAAGKKRMVILGFDGVEPSVVETMLEAGELPSLAKLKEQGSYQRMRSSNPPQSPTAWSSFITGKHAGNHGIFDFLRMTPSTYMPGLGFGSTTKPELAADGSLTTPPVFENYRQGEPFWVAANRKGVRCKLLNVPYGFPPDELEDSVMLCGLEMPDIRGTQSTFYAMSEALKEKESVGGGMKLPLSFSDNTATVQIPGPRHPVTRKDLEVALTVKVDRPNRKVAITVQGQTQTLEQGAWSGWFEWAFEASASYTIKAISRIHVFDAGDEVKLYMTCLQYHPNAPFTPISDPPDYAGELAGRCGFYPTIGWAYDTKALQKDQMTEDIFIDYGNQVMAWREQLTLDEIAKGGFDLLISGWTITDRSAHMFWRFRDKLHPMYDEEGAKKYGRAIEDTYARMDAIVGKVRAQLTANDALIVLSDHGFHSWRTKFSVNTWLVRNGYLAVAGKPDPATAWTDDKFFRTDSGQYAYDWSKTKAYGLGLGGIYLNIEGREGKGIVPPGEAASVAAELKRKLLAVTAPQTGDKIFKAVYTKEEAFAGAANEHAPDIELGYADGYQTNKASAAAAAPKDVFSPNEDKWSGEHAASDAAITPGILFASEKLASDAAIVDMAPTVLKYFGLEAPADYEGKALV